MGEINIAIIAPLNGTCDCDNPMAASVPSETAIIIATGAIDSEFMSGSRQSGLLKKSS